MKIAAITDIGSCRQENQDNYCAQQLAGGTAWGIVCDGMGGVNGGRIAARIATDTMQQYFARHMKALQPGMEKTFLMRGFDITNRAVYEKSTSDPEMQGMGTTGVCAYASRGMAHVVHAGDSRAYLFHAGGLRQITRDHSMVQQLVDSGQITRERAAVHPQKNLITRALGVSANIVPEYNRCEIEAGDILLLCTDGLTNMVAQLAAAAEGELPSVLVESAYQQEMEQIQQQLQMQRLSLDRYLSQIHQTRESFTAAVHTAAEKNTRARMALLQIAQNEGLVPTEEDIDKTLSERAERTKKTLEEVKAASNVEAIRRNEGIRRAADYVIKHSTIEEK